MIFLGLALFVLGLIMMILGSINIGKKQYKVTFEQDVEKIISNTVNDFMSKNTKTICNHKWEDKTIINLYREGKSAENSLPISRIYVQQCKHCGVINKNKIEF